MYRLWRERVKWNVPERWKRPKYVDGPAGNKEMEGIQRARIQVINDGSSRIMMLFFSSDEVPVSVC